MQEARRRGTSRIASLDSPTGSRHGPNAEDVPGPAASPGLPRRLRLAIPLARLIRCLMETVGRTGTWRTRRVTRGACSASFALTLALLAAPARASTLDSSGKLVFDSNAVLTLGFESLTDAQTAGGSWLSWSTNDYSLVATGVTATSWAAGGSAAGAPGVVSLPQAPEGTHALMLTASSTVAFAVVDPTLFKTLETQRVEVSFWGFSMGAEPQLDVVYPSVDQRVGPNGFGHLIAVRTGRETSDGWAEYSTGPIDGRIFGDDPIAAIILTARFPDSFGIDALDSENLAPPDNVDILDPSAYALADAIEIQPLTGSPMPVTQCTQANVATTCGVLGECQYGRCVDGTIVWGAVPQASDHREDLVNRWAFVAEHLGADRAMAASAPAIFSSSATASVAGATASPGFYGGLNTLVNSLRDGHTALGGSPSNGTAFFEGLGTFSAYSGLLDFCFGLATDNLPGGSGGQVYSVFWMAPDSPVGSTVGTTSGGTLVPGDMLTQIDGLAPDAWLDTVGARFRYSLPNDPSSEPSDRALLLSEMLAKYATTAEFTSCTAAGVCTPKTIAVGEIMYALLTGAGYGAATGYSRLCTGRFTDAVSTWTPSDDASDVDVPAVESTATVTSLELDGFEGDYSSATPGSPYPTWEAPIEQATSSGKNLLIDARLGHGGRFLLGRVLVHRIRGTGDPYFAFSVPRGTWDDIDPTWIFDPSLATCVDANSYAPDLCGWTGADSDAPTLTNPPAAGVKIAWLNGNDVSMNDFTPREVQGATNVRVFGPHPTSGAYGEISDIPPIVGAWSDGSTQVLDSRFGSSFATAIAAPWASGTGVIPDQVVTQNVSDILAGTDTVLVAAKAWLAE